MQSQKYSLNQVDIRKIATTILFSAGSAIVASLIVIVGDLDLGAYAILTPVINTVLYAAKKYLDGRY